MSGFSGLPVLRINEGTGGPCPNPNRPKWLGRKGRGGGGVALIESQDMPHYSVYVTRIEVGTEFLNLSTSSSGTVNNIMAIVDGDTTLAYLPELIYEHLMKKIIAG